jgi:peptidoglycan/LPS O-acetylase OafA/YrhL
MSRMSMLKFRGDIEGLRGVAIILVLAYHIDQKFVPGGFIGVDVFFILSGYLMAAILNNNSNDVAGFYRKRLLRIIPAYFCMLLVVGIGSSFLLLQDDYQVFYKSLINSYLFISNIYFSDLGGYFLPKVHEMPLLHTWSLSIELQFYLIVPALIWLFSKRFIHYHYLVPASLVLILYSQYQEEFYFSFVGRLPCMLIGLWIYYNNIQVNNKLSNITGILGLVVLISGAFFIKGFDYPGFSILFPIISTVFILSSEGSVATKILNMPWLRYVGRISFSVYLWHWPILALYRYYIGEYYLEIIELFFLLLIILSASMLSYYYVEQRFVSKKSKSKSYLYSICIIGSLCVAPFFEKFNEWIVLSLPEPYTQYANINDICHGKVVGDCLFGEKGSERKILLIGDSHAAHLVYFAKNIGTKASIEFKIITASSCVNIPGFDITRLPKWAQIKCLNQTQEMINVLEQYDEIVIAGKWLYQMESKVFQKALIDFLFYMNTRGKKVIILSQIPILSGNIARILRFQMLGLPSGLSTVLNWQKGNDEMYKLTVDLPSVIFLDLSDSPLFSTPPYYKGELIYRDISHLNEVGSWLYGDTLNELKF